MDFTGETATPTSETAKQSNNNDDDDNSSWENKKFPWEWVILKVRLLVPRKRIDGE